MTRYRNKRYWKLGNYGELQYGRISHSVVLWWKGNRYVLYAGRVKVKGERW